MWVGLLGLMIHLMKLSVVDIVVLNTMNSRML